MLGRSDPCSPLSELLVSKSVRGAQDNRTSLRSNSRRRTRNSNHSDHQCRRDSLHGLPRRLVTISVPNVMPFFPSHTSEILFFKSAAIICNSRRCVCFPATVPIAPFYLVVSRPKHHWLMLQVVLRNVLPFGDLFDLVSRVV